MLTNLLIDRSIHNSIWSCTTNIDSNNDNKLGSIEDSSTQAQATGLSIINEAVHITKACIYANSLF